MIIEVKLLQYKKKASFLMIKKEAIKYLATKRGEKLFFKKIFYSIFSNNFFFKGIST